MRFVPTRLHGGLDYILGLVLALFPIVGGRNQGGLIGWGPMLLGQGMLLYSIFTNYELGLLRLIPLKVHLVLDAAAGVVLIGLALLFEQEAVRLFLITLGIIEIGSSLVTRTVTSDGPGLASPAILDATHRSKVAMPIASGPRTRDGRPDYPAKSRTNEELRGAIDSGKTSDKIAMTDPAAAPLGSDDEAADLHDEEGLATARRQSHRA